MYLYGSFCLHVQFTKDVEVKSLNSLKSVFSTVLYDILLIRQRGFFGCSVFSFELLYKKDNSLH